jgi:hypothetical protein
VQALVELPAAQRLSIGVTVDLPDGGGDRVRTLTAPRSAAWTSVRLLLPDQTPEGEYQARLEWSGGTMPAVVAVRAHPKVLVVPATVNLRAAGGDAVTLTVAVHNAGNVGLEIRKVYPVALEHIRALDRAIIAGLTSEQTHLDRFGVVADSLAGDQAGLIRAVVTDGAGTVPPGHTQQVALELRMPPSLAAGTTYSGLWLVGDTEVPVVVEALAGPDPAAKPGSTRTRSPRKSTKEKS